MQTYYVLTKFVNPKTKNAVTNRTDEKYERFSYVFSDGEYNQNEVQGENDPSNQKFDMLFYYDGTIDITTEVSAALSTSLSVEPKIIIDRFKKITGDGWFISSIKTSLKAALESAKPIIKAIGTKNVKIVKEAPTVMTINLDV